MWENYYYPVNLDSQVASFDSDTYHDNWVLMAYMALKPEFRSKTNKHVKFHMRNEKVNTYPAFAIKVLKTALEENEQKPLENAQANTQYIAEIHALLGIAYEKSENYKKAYKYYTKAGDLGKFHRARLIITGQGTVSRVELAFDLIKERSAAGDLNAEYAHALIMSTGRFLKTEIVTFIKPIEAAIEAEAKFIQAADRNIDAAFTLAEIYLDRQDENLGKMSFMIKGEPLSEERQQKVKELLEKVAKSNTRQSKKANFYLYQFFPNEYPELKESVLTWLKEISNNSSHPFSTQARFYYISCMYFDVMIESIPNDHLTYVSSIFNNEISTYKLKDYGQKYSENLTLYNKTKENLSLLISKFNTSELIVISDFLRELIERENALDDIFRIIRNGLNTGADSTYDYWFEKHSNSKKFFNYCYIALIIAEHLLKDENRNSLGKNIENDIRILSAISNMSLYIYFNSFSAQREREIQAKYLKNAAEDLLPIINDSTSENTGSAAYLLSILKSYPACKELLKDLKDAKVYMEMSKAAGFDQAIIALKPFPLVTAFKAISGAVAGTAAQVAVAATSAASQVAQTVASVNAARAPTPKPDLDLGDVELAEIERPSLESVINGELSEPDIYMDADTDTNWPEKAPMPETQAPTADLSFPQ